LKVAYRVGQADFEAFLRHYYDSSKRSNRFYRLVWWWVLALLVAYSGLQVAASRGAVAVGIWVLLTIAWVVSGQRILDALVGWFLRGSLRGADLSSHLGEQSLSVEPEGLRYSTEVGGGIMNWPAIRRMESTPTHTFIYVSDTSAFIIPHASLLPRNPDELVAAIRARIPAA